MRSLPHAENRNPRCARHVCEFAYFQVHLTGDDGQIQDSESLHVLSRGQVHGLGDERTGDLEDDISVAGRAMKRDPQFDRFLSDTISLLKECIIRVAHRANNGQTGS